MSEYTSATYKRSLETLRKGLGAGDGLSFLTNDTKKVIDWIESSKYAMNTKKLFYITIVATLKKTTVQPEEAIAAYRVKMDELNKKSKEQQMAQKLSPAEEGKFVQWPDIMKCFNDKIRPAVKDVTTFQEYLIAALYCLTPPVRLDYANMRIVTKKPEKPEGNYLVMDDKPYFLFTQYKTAAKYGEQVNPVPQKLLTIIYEWLAMVDSEWLLINSKGQPMTEWQLGQTIIKVFEKHLGKPVGASMLRHSYVSHVRENELSIKKSNNLASAMMHSPHMNQTYRRLQ
jgi:integrase